LDLAILALQNVETVDVKKCILTSFGSRFILGLLVDEKKLLYNFKSCIQSSIYEQLEPNSKNVKVKVNLKLQMQRDFAKS